MHNQFASKGKPLMKILGNVIGITALIFFFLSYQVRDKKKLLYMQIAATVLTCLQYLLVGAYSGFALNVVCLARNIVYYFKEKKNITSPALPIVFAVLMAVVSIFSWDGYFSLFIISALIMNTLALGFLKADGVRKSVLVTSPLVIVYNAVTGAYSGVLNESVVIVSSVIGLIRFAKAKNDK